MNEFDLKAAEWDKNRMHWDRSEAIARQIKKFIPLKKSMRTLEYGAGTGITSFILKDYVKEITLMDNSSEMVKVMKEKIRSAKVRNLKVLQFDLENSVYVAGKFDFIFTQMVLHHISDTDSIIYKFSKLLNPGGYLAIADLYKEDGSFHGEGFNGHKGFDPDKLSEILKRNNFTDATHQPCYTIDITVSDTETRKYDVFLLTAHLL
jgi:tRNA (cmo5U34)-methyltransferase